MFALIAALVLLTALGFRAWNLDWSLPALSEEAAPVHEAIRMWGFESGQPTLDPGTAGWPALSFYVQRGLQQIHFVLGGFDAPLDYYVQWRVDPTATILIGRATSLFALLVVTLVAMLVGRRLAGMSGGVLAGLMCVASPMLLRHSQRIEPDSLVALFSALALLWLLRIARDGRTSDYLWCGVWIGLGAASKYTPGLLALSVWAVHLDRIKSESGSLRFAGLDDRRLWIAAAGALGIFALTNPYLITNLSVLRRDFAYQAEHMKSGHFGHASHGLGYGRYLLHVLPQALGWLGFLAGILGMVSSFGDRRGGRVLVWYTVPYLVVLGAFSTSFDRYMLPVVLPFAIAAALLLRRLQPRRLLWSLAGVLLLLQPALASIEFQRLQSTPGTRELAAAWVAEYVDREGEALAMEFHGPDLVFGDPDGIAAEPVFERLNEDQRQRLRDRDAYRALRIPMYSVRADLAAYYYDLRHYLAYDWLIISGGVERRYRASPEEYPEQIAFYDQLRDLAEPAWSVDPEGRIRGPRIEIWRIDDAFRSRVSERLGKLDPDHHRAWTGRVHPPHFTDFLLTVAEHAEFRERWYHAALYYGTLAGAVGDAELHRLGLEKCAASLFNAGDFEASARWYEELSKYPDQRLVALGNLGLIAERQGDYAAARIRYEHVVEADPGGEVGEWARQRLDALPEP
jgi:4-amino-4-deoxy-L-arabinose transferase-like glycosyltransferase